MELTQTLSSPAGEPEVSGAQHHRRGEQMVGCSRPFLSAADVPPPRPFSSSLQLPCPLGPLSWSGPAPPPSQEPRCPQQRPRSAAFPCLPQLPLRTDASGVDSPGSCFLARARVCFWGSPDEALVTAPTRVPHTPPAPVYFSHGRGRRVLPGSTASGRIISGLSQAPFTDPGLSAPPGLLHVLVPLPEILSPRRAQGQILPVFMPEPRLTLRLPGLAAVLCPLAQLCCVSTQSSRRSPSLSLCLLSHGLS